MSGKTLESLREFEDISLGKKPAREERKGDIDVMMNAKFRTPGKLVEVGKVEYLREDHPKIAWDKIKGSLSSFHFYHYDILHLFLGRHYPFLRMFRAAMYDPPMPPLLRVMLPGNIIKGGSDPLTYGSMLAMEKCDMSERFRRYIVEETFPMRNKNEYWEILGHRRPFSIDGKYKFTLNLYLPASMEYTILPATDPGTGLVMLYKGKPDPNVVEAGKNTLLGGKGIIL